MASDETTYDYVVIGAGSGGAVVAGRLSEDPGTRVLLIEAGGSHRKMAVRVPAAFAQQFHTDLDWDYTTEPEPHLDGRRIYHPRGRMLGGCSSQNAMIYIRGNRADFDGWAEAGAKGWSYDEVLPYFRRSEHNSRGADALHGGDGPQYVEDPRSPNEVSQRMVEAMVEAGLPRNDDFNGAEQVGAGLYQVTQHRGRRWTTADGWIAPARRRKNFTVWTDSTVLRLALAGGAVAGVDVEREGRRVTVRAEREVVLAAGAFGTPHVLMLSGVGPADHLREHGVDVVVDNPNVGAHLMDHPMYVANWETSATGTLAEAEKPAQLLRFLLRGRGLLTSNVGEAGAFFHTRDRDDAPAMQLIGAPAYFWQHGAATHPTPAVALGCSLVGSRSTGEVRLRTADPKIKPAVRFDYFAEPEDMAAMVAGLERAREVMAAGPLRGIIGKEIHPGGDVGHDDLVRDVRRKVEHTYHPSCTARIGTEVTGVVDPELRVHGVTGLRVADASVFPRVTHGNTHAPTLMVGEKAADLLRG
ncbi:GMC family oxidoreductase N-terminal domain-containing protein [Nocardioides sp. YIM 152588]|uniref:GMC family oxidoreductase n=1 Tax=Nocardioides sp. YIM 152588 TaxID=3158259 RepID=UPI0032E3C29E